MSYQVLARKWRPRSFDTLVGQEHVVRALTHALEAGRLHHAYLFTGTRGVGKTTLARILAKSLNCETGVGASPCGQCSACQEIDRGRFVDLLEVDAATNTRVDEMRQLLENAVYAPTRGRYKVYVIDEVHMLSNSAFNAMLKTLEEPPEHVKFILATTDPQKIPVTVLSRCLQFNLKQMPQAAIVGHLQHVLEQESVAFDLAALRLLAHAAAGSMRDALSLLDQAIAHGAGRVDAGEVRAMLGTVDTDQVFAILDALAAEDAAALLAVAEQLAGRSLSFDAALQELAAVLVRVQAVQLVPDCIEESDPDRERLLAVAERLPAERVQLAYQIAVQGRAELPLAPDAQAGFVMTLLRLLAFVPDEERGGGDGGGQDRGRAPRPAVRRGRSVAADTTAAPVPARDAPPRAVAPTPAAPPSEVVREPVVASGSSVPVAAPVNMPAAIDWIALVPTLGLTGMVRELAQHCTLEQVDGQCLRLHLAPGHRHLLGRVAQDKLQQALGAHLGQPIRLTIELDVPTAETPAAVAQRGRDARQSEAIEAIEGDPFVREFIDVFDARLVDTSIRPVG